MVDNAFNILGSAQLTEDESSPVSPRQRISSVIEPLQQPIDLNDEEFWVILLLFACSFNAYFSSTLLRYKMTTQHQKTLKYSLKLKIFEIAKNTLKSKWRNRK